MTNQLLKHTNFLYNELTNSNGFLKATFSMALQLSYHVDPVSRIDTYFFFLFLIGGSICFNMGLSRSIFFSGVLEIICRQLDFN